MFSQIWVPATWMMWRAWFSLSTVPHVPDNCEVQRERCSGICVQCQFCSTKMAAAQSEERGEPDAGGISMNDKSENDESKTKGFFAEFTDSAETLDWKVTAGSIPQGKLLVTFRYFV